LWLNETQIRRTIIMKKWVKKLSYFVTGGAFIAGGILVGRADVSTWWSVAMGVIGFSLNAIGGFFVQPDQP
jgi:hypothetical protein